MDRFMNWIADYPKLYFGIIIMVDALCLMWLLPQGHWIGFVMNLVCVSMAAYYAGKTSVIVEQRKVAEERTKEFKKQSNILAKSVEKLRSTIFSKQDKEIMDQVNDALKKNRK